MTQPISRPHTWLGPRRPLLFALAAFCGVLALGAWLLLTPPYIGMADNGDFFRIINPAGIYHLQRDDSVFFNYYTRQFGVHQHYNQYAVPFISSQALVIQAAKGLDWLLTQDALFDLRVQAALLLPLLALAVSLLVYTGLDGGDHWIVQGLVALLALAMFADSAYMAYFSSFFGESVVYLSTLLLCVSLLVLARRPKRPWLWLAFYMVCALFLISSKQQNAPVGILLVPLTLRLCGLGAKKLWRGVCIGCAAVLAASGIAMYALIPDDFVTINQYHAMTRGVLLQAPNPEEALAEFGIDAQYSILADTIYFDRTPLIDPDDPILHQHFYSHYNFFSLLAYYLRHPDRLLAMLDLATQNGFSIAPYAMGNYEASAGYAPGARTLALRGYSRLKLAAAPNAFGSIILLLVLVMAIYGRGYVQAHRLRSAAQKLPLEMMATLWVIGLSQMVISIIGAGDADLGKHLFLFNVCVDVLLFWLIAGGLRLLGQWWKRRAAV